MRTVLNLSNLPWVPGRRKRNQAIFEECIAQRIFDAGLFVNYPISVRMDGQAHWGIPKLVEVARPTERIRVFDARFTVPFVWRQPIQQHVARRITDQLKTVLGSEPYLLWINSINDLALALAELLAPGAQRRIFDSSDDFVQFFNDKAVGQHNLERVLALADDVICVNAHLATKMSHPRIHVFENGTDFENFQHIVPDYALQPVLPKPSGAQYVGFSGGLNLGRIDLPLLEQLFTRLPDTTFLFVGYCSNREITTFIERFPNAAFLPAVPYNELPSVVRSFDVAIVPHLDNEHTRGNDLLKILDYLACGVPVVSTRCSNVEKYGKALLIADSHEDFVGAVQGLLRGAPHDPSPGLDIARNRDWSRIVPSLAAMLGLKPAGEGPLVISACSSP